MYVHDINLEKSRNIYVPIQLSRAIEKVTSNLRSLDTSFVNILNYVYTDSWWFSVLFKTQYVLIYS